MSEIKIVERPLIDGDHLGKRDVDALIALPMGSQVTYTGFASPVKLMNGANFAQGTYMRGYMEALKVKIKIVEKSYENMSLTLQLVNR